MAAILKMFRASTSNFFIYAFGYKHTKFDAFIIKCTILLVICPTTCTVSVDKCSFGQLCCHSPLPHKAVCLTSSFPSVFLHVTTLSRCLSCYLSNKSCSDGMSIIHLLYSYLGIYTSCCFIYIYYYFTEFFFYCTVNLHLIMLNVCDELKNCM